jgi:ABC-type glycerol-3-phosphate transport system substrate-binding protein
MPSKPITLTYWDATGLYLSDQGAATLDKEFMAKYPNVKVVRVPKAFATITSTERLAASGPNAPGRGVRLEYALHSPSTGPVPLCF